MSQIKGSKLTSKIAFVRRAYGDAMVERVIEALPAADQPLLRDVLDIRWYPSALYDRLVQTICRVAANGDETVYDRMGIESADLQLNNIYAAFKRSDLVKMFKNMVPMHAHLNDPARMQVDSSRDDECTIVVTQPRSTRIGCRISRAFYRRVAEIAGAEDVRIRERTCTAEGDDACRFVLHWAHVDTTLTPGAKKPAVVV